MMAKVSILFRTRNEAKTIGSVLEGVLSQSVTDKEILVVDLESTDGTLDIVRRYPVRCYEIPLEWYNYGFPLNHGFEKAKGDYVASLSAHALPASEKWLEALLTAIEEEGVAGVMGRNLPYPDCNPFERRELLRIERARPQELTEETPFTFGNANCMIRKKVWEKVPFNERLPYSEDKEWARRVRALGYRLKYEPAAAVYHSHNRTLKHIEREFHLSAMADAMMQPAGLKGYSTVRLIGKAFFGMIADGYYIVKEHLPVKWLLIAPLRRAVIVSARFKGCRQIPFSTSLWRIFLERPWILLIKRLNAFLSARSAQVACWVRRSPYPIHPKYLIQGNGASFWFEKIVEGKGRLLDVGSDLGSQTLAAGRRVHVAVGFDIRKERVLLAHRRKKDEGISNVFFSVGNAEKLWPFRDGAFDVLLMSDVLEHLENEERALEEGYRVLRPGGTLLLVLPNKETSWKKKQSSLGICSFADRDHKREYLETDLRDLLERHHFELEDLQRVVLDTPWEGVIDFIGALNLSYYRRWAKWKQEQVILRPEETTGFRMIAKKVSS